MEQHENPLAPNVQLADYSPPPPPPSRKRRATRSGGKGLMMALNDCVWSCPFQSSHDEGQWHRPTEGPTQKS